MKDLINGQPEQDIEHCATCIHAADSEDICILRKCKYAIAELKNCYEPKQPEIIRCRDCKYWDPFPSSSSAPEYHQCMEFGGVMTASRADDFCSRAERREVSE